MIAGGSAAHTGGYVTVRQVQAVISIRGYRLVGETGAMKRGEKPIARAVAGENSSGTVTAMGGRRQPTNQ
jgi:hypothetical protein